MKLWIIYIIIYAILNGLYRSTKKLAITKNNTIYEVLAYITLISLILVIPISKDIFSINIFNLLIILVKAIIVAISWYLSLYAISNMDLSLHGILNLSRIIFTTILSIIILGEVLTINTIIGISLVILGIYLVNKTSNNTSKITNNKAIIANILFCFFSSISAIIEKKLLLHITSSQLQFWTLFFITIIYFIILFIKQRKINHQAIYKNYYLILSSIFLVVGDRFLYLANAIPSSSVIIMTLIKQLSAIVTIILGKFIFKEKNIIKRLLCSILIIIGIIIILI